MYRESSMPKMPLIVGYGGINAAGRSSDDHGYRRMVIDALDSATARDTWQALHSLTGQAGPLDSAAVERLRQGSLVRKLEASAFDPAAIPWNRRVKFRAAESSLQFDISARQLPDCLPPGWQVAAIANDQYRVTIAGDGEFLVPDKRVSEVGAAGQLPTGFDPAALYPARSHPRGLQLSIFAASDALGNLGISWERVVAAVRPDQVCVYAGSAMAQQDEYGNGGLLGARASGRRVSSKNLALGLAEMPADFINAYVLGSVGITGHNMGACATFHYNLRAAVNEITAGRARVALVGGAEASLTPEVMDGYTTMGALGTDAGLLALEGRQTGEPDYRRACRPFGRNCGFTLAEGAQFVILMEDELALELGAEIYGMVPEVFVQADGNKKSISGPGIGNYITVSKAAALARAILGERALRERSMVHAHGTGTPQNRLTESAIFSEVATTFGIDHWPVAAIKCFVGHTIAVAGGDQLISSLGTWRYGVIPGITTIDEVAEDVHTRGLAFSTTHRQIDPDSLDISLLNAKGFGGNNATALVLGPGVAASMVACKHGRQQVSRWQDKREQTRAATAEYHAAATAGQLRITYQFDHDVRQPEHLSIGHLSLKIDGYRQPIDLEMKNPYAAYLPRGEVA
jgi:acetoacetyl-[acyl-carrier protein] synthase